MAETAIIRRLIIDRYRGIKRLEWNPAPAMNVILGGGDVGKTTILEAVSLLLSPSNAITVSESDYWQRDNTQEFVIEAVIALPGSSAISTQQNFAWPWAWDGNDAVQPATPADGADDMPAPDDPVYRVRVVFGIIKSVLGFRQFLLRGIDNVRGEWNLVTMAWNMKRMFVLAGAN